MAAIRTKLLMTIPFGLPYSSLSDVAAPKPLCASPRVSYRLIRPYCDAYCISDAGVPTASDAFHFALLSHHQDPPDQTS